MADKKRKKPILGVKITRGEIPQDDWNAIHKFALALEKGRFNEYIEVLQDTKKLFWKSFVSGVAKGLGAVVGATVVVALIVALLAMIGGILPGEDPVQKTGEQIQQNTGQK